jgi:hypothetical protein
MRSAAVTLLAMPVLGGVLWSSPVDAALIPPWDVQVMHLELTGGSVDFEGRFSRQLDRLFDRPGRLVMNVYQPGPDIVEPIVSGRRTFSLFTSGVQGAAPPWASVKGDRIMVDLSSLFFGVSKGDRLQAWNIGGFAGGSFNPETLEFCLTWDRLFGDGRFGHGTFELQGVVAFVPLAPTAVLFATGLVIVMGVRRKTATRHSPPAAA